MISPDSHVRSVLPGWRNALCIVLIAPQLGARFTQMIVEMGADSALGMPLPDVQRFVYVSDGDILVTLARRTHVVKAKEYAYIPPNTPHTIKSTRGAKLMLIEKRYQPIDDTLAPKAIFSSIANAPRVSFMNDEGVHVTTLLPNEMGFDMAVNIMSFAPGAMLPFVEAHVMEHGLTMLSGQGVYRLDNDWHPVQADDVIWMAPFCPQWFGALGKVESSYLIYKDWNRDPLI